MKRTDSSAQNHRGQAIALIALMAVALVAFVGLALDGAQVFENRRWMQNGADASAMAGAYGLGGAQSDAAIAARIQSYAAANGSMSWSGVYLVDASSTATAPQVGSGVTDPGETYNCVRVSTYVTFPTYFVGVVGFDTLNTTALATACAGYEVQQHGPGLRPLAVATTTFELNTEYCMFDSLPENHDPPAECTGAGAIGSFGWVLLGSDGSTIQNQLINGYQGTYEYWTENNCSVGPTTSVILPVPSCLELRTGDIASTRNELETLAANQTEFVVPLWDYQCFSGSPICDIGSGSEAYIHIVGFANFKVTTVVMTGSPKYIKGMFVGYVEYNEICTPGSPGCVVSEITKKAVQLYR